MTVHIISSRKDHDHTSKSATEEPMQVMKSQGCKEHGKSAQGEKVTEERGREPTERDPSTAIFLLFKFGQVEFVVGITRNDFHREETVPCCLNLSRD